MSRHAITPLYGALVAAAMLKFATNAQALTIQTYGDGEQSARASGTYWAGGSPRPLASPFVPMQEVLTLTPGSVEMLPDSPGRYSGGAGVTAEKKAPSSVVFYPDVVQPVTIRSFGAASARTGHLRVEAATGHFERWRTVPRADGVQIPQFDNVGGTTGASASISNVWLLDLSRDKSAVPYRAPITFGLTLNVDARFASNPGDAYVFSTPLDEQAYADLSVNISFYRLLNLDNTPLTTVVPGAGPAVVTDSYQFHFDASNQGRQTLRFEMSPQGPSKLWPAPAYNFWDGTKIIQKDDGLPHPCWFHPEGTPIGDNCVIRMGVDIGLIVNGVYQRAEASVAATWDIAGPSSGTYEIETIGTDAAHWGEAADPLIASRPHLIPEVPEPNAAGMLLAGLGIVGWLRRRAGSRPAPVPTA